MTRRHDRRGRVAHRASSGPPPITLYGGTGWDTTNRLGTGLGGGFRGNVGGHTIGCLFRINTQVDQGRLLDYLDGSGKGWDLFQTSATTLAWRNANLAGNGWFTSAAYSPAPDVGKLQLSVLVYTGTVIEHWCSDEKVGADVAVNGYTLPQTGTTRQVIGFRQNGTAAHTGADIFGWFGCNAVLDAAEIHDLYAEIAQTGLIPTGLTGAAQVCNVGTNVTGANFPATITNEVTDIADFTFYAGANTGIDLVTLTGPVIA